MTQFTFEIAKLFAFLGLTLIHIYIRKRCTMDAWAGRITTSGDTQFLKNGEILFEY